MKPRYEFSRPIYKVRIKHRSGVFYDWCVVDRFSHEICAKGCERTRSAARDKAREELERLNQSRKAA